MLLTSRKRESIKHLPMNVIDYISRPGRAFFSPSVVCLLCLLIAPSCFAQVNDQVAELLHKGKTAFDSGQSAEALGYFTRASVLAPQIAEIKLNIALALKEEEKYPEEIAALQSALSVKPTLKGANLFLGVAYYRLDDYGKATQALKNELRRNPKDAQVLMWLGVVDLAAHNFKSAAAYLDQAAELAPKDADILYHRGRAHLLLSQDSYQKMYQSDPGSWRVHEVLAQAYSTADRQTEAISEYKEAIRLAPEETGLHLELGDQYYAASKPDSAEAEYLAELKLDPYSDAAMYKLGSLRVDRGNASEAIPLLESVLARKPEFSEAYYYLGRAQDAMGEDEKAVASLNLAITTKPSADTLQQTYYQLSRVYRKLHRVDQAKVALSKFEELKTKSDATQQQKLQDRMKRQERRSEEEADGISR
jgi:tetratricopeptide (TPR) repeat protein